MLPSLREETPVAAGDGRFVEGELDNLGYGLENVVRREPPRQAARYALDR